ncbi:stalk domain-containing protein [Paenibacillus sp. LjRoot153]|uniref:stalk domain-containing protein n=1 Tax=Paenibacillus sp. LjRoot153 TaxID=3342270 RepID=UPI003ED124B0
MKKFILGLSCGLLLAGSSVAFASNTIQALLFPASFEINGSQVEMNNEYQILNVDGHAYVPVRFVSENLGATIDYDSDTERIVVKNKPLDIKDPDYANISVGNLILTKAGNTTKVTGQLKFKGVGNSQNMIGAGLSFYNEDNEKIGEAVISGNNFGVDAQTFVTEGEGDFKNYDTVYLHIGAVNHRIISEAPSMLYKNLKYQFTLNIPSSWEGKYEVEERKDEESERLNFLFINKANKAFGGVLFSISVWTKEDWLANGSTTKGIGQLYKLGEDADHVFLLFPPGDVEYNPHDEKLTAEFISMTDQISKIRRSFILE